MPTKPRDYRLETFVLLGALLDAIQAETHPIGDVKRSDRRTLALRGPNPKGKVCPLDLLSRLGRTTLIEAVDITLRVNVPSAAELSSSLLMAGDAHRALQVLRVVTKLLDIDLDLPSEELIRRFDAFTPFDQDRFLLALRPAYAAIWLGLRLAEIMRRLWPKENPSEGVALPEHVVIAMENDRARLCTWAKLFQLRYWHEELRGECIKQFLPAGANCSEQASNGRYSDVPQIELTQTEVARESFAAQERFDTYMNFGAIKAVRPQGEFAKRQYVAFLFELPSGARVAVLDADKLCPSDHDAIYFFLIAKGLECGTSNWINEAQLSKADLLSRTRGEGAFWGRRYHSLHWKENVQQTLAQLSDRLRPLS